MAETARSKDALSDVVCSISQRLVESVAGHAIAQRLQVACVSATPAAVAGIAHLLLRVGFGGHAELLFDALRRLCPGIDAGSTGLAHVAMQRREWLTALRHWDDLIGAFPARINPYWVATRARVLAELGRSEEARAALESMAFGGSANQLHHRIGLAHLAAHREQWTEALACWDDVLARFPQHDSVPFSRVARAGILAKLGHADEAETVLRQVIQADPWMIGAHVVLIYLLAETGRYDEAARQQQSSLFADATAPVLCRATLTVLLHGRRFDEARAQFERVLHHAVDVESISLLFDAIPQLYEGWRRTETWLDLLRRLDDVQSCAAAQSPSVSRFLRARAKLGLRNYEGYLQEVRQLDPSEHTGDVGTAARAAAAAIASPQFPDYGRPRVFGIGLSKTGTTTLASALQSLGLTTLHWTNPVTGALISEPDLLLFDALTDTPMCVAFEKNYYMFPASKFIYTVRPLESWIRSMLGQWHRVFGTTEFGEFQRQASTPSRIRLGSDFCSIYQTLYLSHADLRQAYAAYDRRVRRFFSDKPADRFLVFDVFAGHGWPELCAFLDKDVPAMPFPFANRAPTGLPSP
jgi:hypothetical protein